MVAKRTVCRGFIFIVVVGTLTLLLCMHSWKRESEVSHLLRKVAEHSLLDKGLSNWTKVKVGRHEPLNYGKQLSRVSDVSRVLVAVFLCECKIEKISLIQETWGSDVAHTVFVTPPECDTKGNPNVEVFQLPSNKLSPPVQIMKGLEYLHAHHKDQFRWFVLVSSETYVSGQLLGSHLSKLNYEASVYIGKPPFTSPDNTQRLKIAPHERVCVGGAGLVISAGSLRTLDSLLKSSQDKIDLNSLIKEKLTSSTTPSVEDLLHEDFELLYMNPENLWDSNQYSDYLTIYPVILQEHMWTLDLLRKTLEYEQLRKRMLEVGDTVNDLHTKLTPTINPKHMIHPHNFYNAPEIDGKEITADNMPSWWFYEGGNRYLDRSVEQRRPVNWETVEDSKEIQLLTSKLEEAASKQHGAWLKLKQIEHYYVYRHGLKGNDYIVDAMFEEVSGSQDMVHQRVRLLRPLAKEVIVVPTKPESREMVHIVVPIGNVNERFQSFLTMYEKEFLTHRENVHLVLSVYGEDDIKFVTQKTRKLKKKFRHFKYTIVKGEGVFTRARAAEGGFKALQDGDLAFLCDVDLTIRRKFLQRCRRSTIRGQQVYFPEMFKLYNMKYAYRNARAPRNPSVSRKHGYWEYYSYGMACMYKSDYSTMDPTLLGWGGEDVDFIKKTLKKGVDVFRAPDTSLIHRWHDNPCKKTRDKNSHWHCIFSSMRTYAERTDLAQYVLELEEKLGVSAKHL